MNKLSCKKCTKCGFINTSSNEKCEKCSNDLGEVEIKYFEKYPIQYVQVCPACSRSNYADKPDFPVKLCFYCQKGRISKIPPKEYVEDKIIKENDNNDSNKKITDKEEKSKDSFLDEIKQEKADIKNLQNQHEDDEKVVEWGNVLGTQSEIKKIILTAKEYGDLSFSITSDKEKYMLGRSANQSEFLAQDRRVGNEHCYLFYQDGYWLVKDNNSKNGTFVDSKDIGINGTHILENGSELKLGHNDDSVAFDIRIE